MTVGTADGRWTYHIPTKVDFVTMAYHTVQDQLVWLKPNKMEGCCNKAVSNWIYDGVHPRFNVPWIQVERVLETIHEQLKQEESRRKQERDKTTASPSKEYFLFSARNKNYLHQKVPGITAIYYSYWPVSRSVLFFVLLLIFPPKSYLNTCESVAV